MDDNARKAIERGTLKARRLLEDDFAAQLEGTFDVLRSGVISAQAGAHLTERQAHQRSRIVAAIEHKQAAGMSPQQAVADYLRDAAFTTLNRFAALKLLEVRKLVLECVSRGEQSGGYKEFCGLAAGVPLLPEEAGYRLYLECLFDELSTEVKVLFNRRDAASILWPRRPCLEAVLAILNGAPLAGVWSEDETLGWIYQYYNDPAERRQLRDVKQGGSAAPRNSRELAERNQFFTPRYVVEFLTDNALGRTWYEMTRGETRLKEQCRYLVRLPNEHFLQPGEAAPELPAEEDLTREELLQRPVYLPHRPLKDPRTILMLDPACGSMHFGLYVFELLEAIYAEAWELEETLGAEALMRPAELTPLHEEYADRDAFLRDVPRLIVERNIHGVDIDPRAVQIAGLALWLRAQRAWQQQGIKPADRPSIRRTQVVCAEPMPGEKELLREFVEREFPAAERGLFQTLLEAIFDRMQLAGEAGSLLKIEDEIREAIDAAQSAWARRRQETGALFTGEELNRISRQPRLDVLWDQLADLDPDANFWEAAEARLLTALKNFAEQAENGVGFRRRLFVEDAAQGFAFIDVCRKRYDVALMNPPFGDASLPSKPYIEETYGDTKGDVYKAFVECFQSRLIPAGYLGIISSRTGFFLGQSEDWRTRVVLRLYRPIVLADLGIGVLDAMVEVAAYVLRSLSDSEARDLTHSLVPVLERVTRDRKDRFSLPKWQSVRDGLKRHQAAAELEQLADHGFIQRDPGDIVRYSPVWSSVKLIAVPPQLAFPPFISIRALSDTDKGATLLNSIASCIGPRTFVSNPLDFSLLPGSPFAYWASPRLRQIFKELRPFESDVRSAKAGLQTSDDFRFVRLNWEIEPASLGSQWYSFVKGGAFSPFYADVHLVVNWNAGGREIYAFNGVAFGSGAAPIRNPNHYFRVGLTWPLRAKAFSPQVMPEKCVFSIRGYAALAPREELGALLAVMSSCIFDYLFKLLLGRFGYPEFVVGVLRTLPFPALPSEISKRLSKLSFQAWYRKRQVGSVSPTSHAFTTPAVLQSPCSTYGTLVERAAVWSGCIDATDEAIAVIQTEIDALTFDLYGLDLAERVSMSAILTTEAIGDETGRGEEEEEIASVDAPALSADLLAYALGCTLGRWDTRYATNEKTSHELIDPFEALPVCSPGMLQNGEGLPARPDDIPDPYPVSIPWDGILVDDLSHPLDIEQRISDVLEFIWPEKTGISADAIEQEACALLGVKSLREYFRKPSAFFAHHLKQYSKSRRQAPIYWPLSTPSGSYTVWLYYHRFQKDTLYRALEHVKEKCLHEERKLAEMTSESGAPPSATDRKLLAGQEDFVAELRGFKGELERVAPLWNPDLNDGVILNYGPLWRMIAYKPWQKAVKAAFDELVAEKYDWSHLAMHLWPERVVPKCATDRSLAIAHGLEDEFWVEQDGKWKARAEPLRPVAELVSERASAAVKTALNSLLAASVPTGKAAARTRGQR